MFYTPSLLFYNNKLLSPLFAPLCFFLIGIFWGEYYCSLWSALFFCCAIIFCIKTQRYLSSQLLLIICFSTIGGLSTLLIHKSLFSYKQRLFCSTAQTLHCTLESIEESEHPWYQYKLVAQATNTKQKSIHTIAMHFFIYTHEKPKLRIHDIFLLKNVSIKHPKSESSFYRYLQREGCIGSFFCSRLNFTMIKRPYFSLKRFIYEYKAYIFEQLHKKTPAETFILFSSLFLGKKVGSLQKRSFLHYHFAQWGLAHYLARSGLHLSLLSFLFLFPLRLLPLRYSFKQIALILLISLYQFLTWTSLSSLRAFITFIYLMLYNAMQHSIHFAHTIVMLTFLLLLSNPFLLFFLDFQLSFGITYALAWFITAKKHTTRMQNIA
ncbi:MAG: ComEC/Rec2 family competence protein [Candidatus Babeliales bacterium]